jgi:PIN domain nuclease of toxin-antitoxin system
LISVWELAKKVEKQQMVLDRPVDEWLDEALSIRGLRLWELTRPVLIDSCTLPQPFHGDPVDQILVATARRNAAAMVTKDQKIRRYAHVQSVW